MVTITIGEQEYETEDALTDVQGRIAEALRGRAVAQITLAEGAGTLYVNASMAVRIVEKQASTAVGF